MHKAEGAPSHLSHAMNKTNEPHNPFNIELENIVNTHMYLK